MTMIINKKQLFFLCFPWVLIVVFSIFFLYWYKPISIRMINIAGARLEDAVEKIASIGCSLLQKEVIYSAYYKYPIIVNQYPQPGMNIKRGQKIAITIGRPLPQVYMPNFIGYSKEVATKIANDHNLYVQIIELLHTDEAGSVFGQYPMPGVQVGDTVVVLYCAQPMIRSRFLVPNVIGLSLADARYLMLQNGIGIRVEQVGFLDTMLIRRQYPEAGILMNNKDNFEISVFR